MKLSSLMGVGLLIFLVVMTLFIPTCVVPGVISMYENSVLVSEEQGINLIEGSGITIVGVASPTADRVDYTISSTGGGGLSDVAFFANSTLVADEIGVNFIDGAGISITATTSTDRVDYTITATGGGGGELYNPSVAIQGAHRYVVPGWVWTQISAPQNLQSFNLYFVPIFVGVSTNYDRIFINVTSGAGGKSARLGVYEWANGEPTDLVLDAGTVNLNPTGVKEITINLTLARGYYALALVGNSSAAQITCASNDHSYGPVEGLGAGQGASQTLPIPELTLALDEFDALSDPAASPNDFAIQNRNCVRLRKSA